jgi:peptidoglycan biosynthesis protein MviN/MurJ (putative lipid II flippase)
VIEAARLPAVWLLSVIRGRGVTRATLMIMAGTLASSVLGLVRLQVIAAVFGQTGQVGAFFAALKTPQQISDLVIGGAVSGVFIPTFARYAAPERRVELARLCGGVLALGTLALAAAAGALWLAAPGIVPALNAGFAPSAQHLTVHLVRVLALALPATGVATVAGALLYALRRSLLPAVAAGIVHLGVIAAAVGLTHRWGVAALAAGVVVGTIGQAVFLLALAWRALRETTDISAMLVGDRIYGSHARRGHGLRIARSVVRDARRGQVTVSHARRGHWLKAPFAPARRCEPLRAGAGGRWIGWAGVRREMGQIARLYVPVVLSMLAGLALQGFDQWLQSRMVDPATGVRGGPSVAALASATTLIQFPAGLVAAALSFAVLPPLAQAAHDDHRSAALVRHALALGLALMLPVCLMYLIGGVPLVALLFQHHAFGATDTARTALALRCYAGELPFLVIEQVALAAFFARRAPRVPLVTGLLSMGAYLLVALPLAPRLGMPALALANAAQHAANAMLLLALLARRLPLFTRHIAPEENTEMEPAQAA